MTRKLQDSSTPLAIKADLAMVALELQDPIASSLDLNKPIVRSVAVETPETAMISLLNHADTLNGRIDPAIVVGLLSQLFEQETDHNVLMEIASSLLGATERMDPTVRAELICSMLERESVPEIATNRSVFGIYKKLRGGGMMGESMMAGGGLSIGPQVTSAFKSAATRASSAERLKQFGRAARALASAIELRKDSDETLLLAYATGLAALSGRVSPAEAARLCGPCTRILTSRLSRPNSNRADLAVALSNLAPRLAAGDAHQVATTTLEALIRESDPTVSENLTQLLITLSDRGDPAESGRLYGRFSEDLARILEKSAANADGNSAVALLAKIAKRLDPTDLRLPGNPVIPTLRRIAEKTEDPENRARLAWGLAPLAERLGQEESAKICGRLAQSLVHSVQVARNESAKVRIIRGLAALAVRLAPDKAVEIVRLIAAGVEEGKDWAGVYVDPNSLVTVFYNLFNDLDAFDSTNAAKLLVAAIAQEKDAAIRATLGAGLCRLAERMTPAEAGRVCGPVVDEMARALVTKTGYVVYLAPGFELSASEVSAGKAEQAAGVLAHALALEKDAFVRYHIASALSLVASRMAAGDAAQICGDSARALSDAVPGEASDFKRQQLVSAIVRLVSQIEAEDAATIIGTTVNATFQDAGKRSE